MRRRFLPLPECCPRCPSPDGGTSDAQAIGQDDAEPPSRIGGRGLARFWGWRTPPPRLPGRRRWSHALVTGPDDDRGAWRVEQAGGGFYEVSWTSPTRLPLTSDRPTIISETLGHVGVASVGADGRTVTATMSADTAPNPDTLDVLLSGDRLDEAGRDHTASVAAPAPAPAPVITNRVADPGLPGPHAVVVSDYALDPVPIVGFEEPVEMVGHVVEPAPDAVTGPRPLVLFLHGRHGCATCPAR